MTTHAVGAANTTSTSSTFAATAAKTEDQFLQLLMTQLTNQDPLKPMDTTEMMQQVISMDSVEQLRGVKSAVEDLQKTQNLSASTLIGKTVQVSANGLYAVGKVDSVRMRSGAVNLVVDGNEYPLNSLVSVQES